MQSPGHFNSNKDLVSFSILYIICLFLNLCVFIFSGITTFRNGDGSAFSVLDILVFEGESGGDGIALADVDGVAEKVLVVDIPFGGEAVTEMVGVVDGVEDGVGLGRTYLDAAHSGACE